MNILTKLGYKKFKIVNQGLVREQVPPGQPEKANSPIIDLERCIWVIWQ